jgi:hypothetical protein
MAGTRTLTLLPGVSVRVAPLLAEHPPCVAKRRQPTETRKEIVSVDQADRNPQSRGRVRERGNRHGICTRVAYFLVQQLPHGGVQSPENISSPCPCSWRRRLLRSGVRTVCGWEVGGGRRWRRRWREEDEWGVEAEGGAEAAEVCAFWGCLVRRKMGGRHALLAPEIVQNAPQNFCVQIDTLDYYRGKSVPSLVLFIGIRTQMCLAYFVKSLPFIKLFLTPL